MSKDRTDEAGDGFGGGIHAGEGIGVALVGAEAGEKIGGDDDEALAGEFVGHLLGPVAEAEDLVDEDDDGGFGFDLGVDDEGLDGAAALDEPGEVTCGVNTSMRGSAGGAATPCPRPTAVAEPTGRRPSLRRRGRPT